jgi:leader peptidase (prepilin peptidase)/N-methyltransferase
MDELGPLHLLLLGPFGRVVAGLWGALWGSFFNVMITRLPDDESVVRPASHCRSCGAPIHWYDNIPVLSYLLLRGRCRGCGASFSPKYLIVELLVLGLSLTMHQLFVVQGMGSPDHLGLRMAQFVITSLFCGVLVAIAFIDLATFRIPDLITYPTIPLCVVLSLFMGHPHIYWDGPVGAVGGYLVIRLIADGYRLATGRDGMGYGDAKLLAMIGGLMGWQVLLPVLFLSAMQGSLIGITALVLMRRRGGGAVVDGEVTGEGEAAGDATKEGGAGEEGEDNDGEEPNLRHAKLPFGPFISLAAIEVLIMRDWLEVFFPYLL